MNCWYEPARTEALLGASVNCSEEGDVGGVYPAGASEQLAVINARAKTIGATIARRNGAPKTTEICCGFGWTMPRSKLMTNFAATSTQVLMW